jgi:hypothetical protein
MVRHSKFFYEGTPKGFNFLGNNSLIVRYTELGRACAATQTAQSALACAAAGGTTPAGELRHSIARDGVRQR